MSPNVVITVQATVHAPVERVWKCWTNPAAIVQWNHASEDWHSTKAENDLRPGGRFSCRMEAKDGSMGFDFSCIYDAIVAQERIHYTLDDGRKVQIEFTAAKEHTVVVESFEAENTNPIELQRDGWQAILDNFKKFAEMDK
ncbi:MAG: polyketide cyclase [Calditrichaeota bacterium]|nr:MAG: polyketide cyclase [Calditrichota bacterium]